MREEESVVNINFKSADQYILENFPVVPAKKILPDWFKTVSTETRLHIAGDTIPTIKQCMPVMDILTSGYIIVNPYELTLFPKDEPGNYEDFNIHSHVDYQPTSHHHKMCPVRIDDNKKHWIKIKHPWTVTTPEGYSCLFLQPFYNFNHDLSLFPAIVDTDKHDLPVEFPGYSMQSKSITLKQGEPLMQVIPFKRDEWNMELGFEESASELDGGYRYKDLFHAKKKYS